MDVGFVQIGKANEKSPLDGADRLMVFNLQKTISSDSVLISLITACQESVLFLPLEQLIFKNPICMNGALLITFQNEKKSNFLLRCVRITIV